MIGFTYVSVQVQVGVEVVGTRGIASLRAMNDEANPEAGRYTNLVLILVGDQSSTMFMVLVIRRWAMKEVLFARKVY